MGVGDLNPELPAELPDGWELRSPGYAVDNGQNKAERKSVWYVRYVDARSGRVKVWADDGNGVPAEVVLACLASATQGTSRDEPR